VLLCDQVLDLVQDRLFVHRPSIARYGRRPAPAPVQRIRNRRELTRVRPRSRLPAISRARARIS
jgi:hypothetical protein